MALLQGLNHFMIVWFWFEVVTIIIAAIILFVLKKDIHPYSKPAFVILCLGLVAWFLVRFLVF